MADPRLSYDNNEVGAIFASYKYDNSTITYSATTSGGSSQVGLAVTLTAGTQYQIETAADGEFVLGKLILVEADGTCVVQVKGYMSLAAGTAATLTEGKAIVGDLLVAAEGYIREVATATAAELGVCRGWIDDPTTTTAVVVCL